MTTPVLAAQQPGDLFAAGLQWIKAQLATVHSESAVEDEGHRLLSFYHEIFFKP